MKRKRETDNVRYNVLWRDHRDVQHVLATVSLVPEHVARVYTWCPTTFTSLLRKIELDTADIDAAVHNAIMLMNNDYPETVSVAPDHNPRESKVVFGSGDSLYHYAAIRHFQSLCGMGLE